MWRIYTNQETLDYLDQKHNIHMLCGPDMELYLCDFMFASMVNYLVCDGITYELSAEFVPDSEYTTLCESYDSNPSLTNF